MPSPPESPLENPFDSGFLPWNSVEPLFLFDPFPLDEEPAAFTPPEPVTSNSGSLTSTPTPVTPNSGSDEPEQNNSRTLTDGSDERKRRRMISNRLSARRSRLRKQRHLENLSCELNQLRTDNRKLNNVVRLALFQNRMVLSENYQLRFAAAALRGRLWDVRRLLLVRRLHQQATDK